MFFVYYTHWRGLRPLPHQKLPALPSATCFPPLQLVAVLSLVRKAVLSLPLTYGVRADSTKAP